MNSRVFLPSELDISAIKTGAVEKNKKGGNVSFLESLTHRIHKCSCVTHLCIYIPHNLILQVVNIGVGPDGKQRVYLQTPPMPLPFGVSPYVDASGQTQSYSLDASFRTADADSAVAGFMFKLRELDTLLLDTGVTRAKEFFGKNFDRGTVEAFYRTLVKQSNPDYPPVVKVKVPLKGGEPDAQFFDEHRNPVGIDYLTKGTTVRMIVEISSIWFVNKTYGVTLKLVQAQAVARPNRMEAFAFVDTAAAAPETAGDTAMDTSVPAEI